MTCPCTSFAPVFVGSFGVSGISDSWCGEQNMVAKVRNQTGKCYQNKPDVSNLLRDDRITSPLAPPTK